MTALDAADLVVVGAGLFGLTIAERVSHCLNMRVVIIERRSHIGGNSFSDIDPKTGIEVHRYGTHIFHTSNDGIWSYVQNFTQFTDYRHKVYTVRDGQLFPVPVNLQTISEFAGKYLNPTDARNYIAQCTGNSSPPTGPESFESRAIRTIGAEIYEALIRGYTHKQWQTDPRTLPASVIARIPVRFDLRNDYFDDCHQGLPVSGYQEWTTRMASNHLITAFTGVDYFDVRHLLHSGTPTVYTGPIDQYFDYCAGNLGWRTIDLQFETHSIGDYQGASVLNYADLEVPYTRTHEFRHLHPERPYARDATVVAREYSRFAERKDEPYYPIGTPGDRRRLDQYRTLANLETKKNNVLFGGRLATYQYLDMHMAIGSALSLYRNRISPYLTARVPLARNSPAYGPSPTGAYLAASSTPEDMDTSKPLSDSDEGTGHTMSSQRWSSRNTSTPERK